MQFWPFKKKTPPPTLTPDQLRDALIAAGASGSKSKVRAFCKDYKSQVTEHAAFVCKVPEELQKSDQSIDHYFQALVAVAQCLANEHGAPALWNQLCGNPGDNPLAQLEEFYGSFSKRMDNLEYEALIAEAKSFIEKVKTLKGGSVRQQEAFLVGRLGELLFHSGRVAESIKPFQEVLELCTQIGDVQGESIHLNNLLEAHRYLDDGHALPTAQRLLEFQKKHRKPTGPIERYVERLRNGTPLCRVVCVHQDREYELDELTSTGEGRYQFQFRRNRLSLKKAMALTSQGNQLASSGQLAAALEKYAEASEVDPYDPDPAYQSGACLLELGAFAKAREAFEEVERLAPAWFRCRTDRWLAEGLESGDISVEEFQVLRVLEDGGLKPKEAISLAENALERFPEFAPLHLCYGDALRDSGDKNGAITAYRRGLELAQEPDLESRLLCALAGALPATDPERKQLIQRALTLNGSLVAHATAKLLNCT
jgi:tetratricopeptide (TPR) repeat protein